MAAAFVRFGCEPYSAEPRAVKIEDRYHDIEDRYHDIVLMRRRLPGSG